MRHGSHLDPPNPFEPLSRVDDRGDLAGDDETLPYQDGPRRAVQFLDDDAKQIVSENRSPDIPFRYSVNPYRGCSHGCAYCYARNTHEYLGFNAGLDFETKILVKRNAPMLFQQFLADDRWRGDPITFSGVTDCYQPAERELRLTRGCLEVAQRCRQPVSVITKNALVLRDLDLLREMATHRLVRVGVSVTTLDPELARAMEPRTSIPEARLRTIRTLADAGVPVRVMVAPIIPGLTDHEAPAILQAAREAGADDAGYVLLRLPQSVAPVFQEWLERTQAVRARKVEQLVRQTRNGGLNDSEWGQRMVGSGETASQIRSMFAIFRNKLGFAPLPELDSAQFRPTARRNGQMRLF